LKSDAMPAYPLAHKQGLNFEVDLLVQVAKSASAVGNCEYSREQRQCATLWGADDGLDMTGDPVSMQNLDLILALDQCVCSLTDDRPPSPTSSPTSSPVALTPEQAGEASNATSGAGSHRTTQPSSRSSCCHCLGIFLVV
jgi:hypothetical protein